MNITKDVLDMMELLNGLRDQIIAKGEQIEQLQSELDNASERLKTVSLPDVSSSTCYIMNRTTDDLIFVTTDKEYADRLYESGEYIMRASQLFNPC